MQVESPPKTKFQPSGGSQFDRAKNAWFELTRARDMKGKAEYHGEQRAANSWGRYAGQLEKTFQSTSKGLDDSMIQSAQEEGFYGYLDHVDAEKKTESDRQERETRQAKNKQLREARVPPKDMKVPAPPSDFRPLVKADKSKADALRMRDGEITQEYLQLEKQRDDAYRLSDSARQRVFDETDTRMAELNRESTDISRQMSAMSRAETTPIEERRHERSLDWLDKEGQRAAEGLKKAQESKGRDREKRIASWQEYNQVIAKEVDRLVSGHEKRISKATPQAVSLKPGKSLSNSVGLAPSKGRGRRSTGADNKRKGGATKGVNVKMG